MLWFIIYVAAQLFKFVIGPFFILLYINAIKRVWNYFFVESIQEWIYINYYSKGDLKYSAWYMRLCDKSKANRAALVDTSLQGIYKRGKVRRVGNYLMLSVGLIAAMWVGAFGLSQEYAMPAWTGNLPQDQVHTPDYEAYETYYDYESNNYNERADSQEYIEDELYIPGVVRPSLFPSLSQVFFALTEEASYEGARLRDSPGTESVVIEMLFGYELLMYLGYYVPDEDVVALYWLHVRTPSGTEGFIASQLVLVAH